MELRQLKQFVIVAEELHFARAAEPLGMEQSDSSLKAWSHLPRGSVSFQGAQDDLAKVTRHMRGTNSEFVHHRWDPFLVAQTAEARAQPPGLLQGCTSRFAEDALSFST